MEKTTTAPTTETQEAFLVAYYMSDHYGESCSWCDAAALVRIVATPEELTDYACEECAAGHMESNADVLHEEV